MPQNEMINTLNAIQVDLLRYWSQEKDETLRKELSEHLDQLAVIIKTKSDHIDYLNSRLTGGHNGQTTPVPRY